MKKVIIAVVASALFAGCGGGGGSSAIPSAPIATIPVATPTPSPAPTPIQPGAQYVALGDSITFGMYAQNYTTQGYAADLATDLQANLTNLGLPGETSSSLIVDELPKIPATAQVITLFIGTNDELQVAEHGADVATTAQIFAANMREITATLRATYPRASIIVSNLPNLADMPEWKSASAPLRATISQLNQAMNSAIDGLGFQVVDLRCDARTYDPSNLYYAGLDYGFVHPDTQGHVFYAADFYATTKGTLKETQACPYLNPV